MEPGAVSLLCVWTGFQIFWLVDWVPACFCVDWVSITFGAFELPVECGFVAFELPASVDWVPIFAAVRLVIVRVSSFLFCKFKIHFRVASAIAR